MKNTIDVLKQDLSNRIESMKLAIESAEICLDGNDLLQCAVRLQEAEREARFDTLLMNVYDSIDS